MDYYESSEHLDEVDYYLPEYTFCPCCGKALARNPKDTVVFKSKTVDREALFWDTEGSYKEFTVSKDYTGQSRLDLHTICPRCKSDFQIVYTLEHVKTKTRSHRSKDGIANMEYDPEFKTTYVTYNYKTTTTEKDIRQYMLKSASIVCLKGGKRYRCEYDIDEDRWFDEDEMDARRLKEFKTKEADLIARATKLYKREHSVRNFNDFEEMYRELKEASRASTQTIKDLFKQYEALVEELLPAFREKHKQDKEARARRLKIYRWVKVASVVLVVVAIAGMFINDFTISEQTFPAVVNTEYQGRNKGASDDHRYKFTLDKPGVLNPIPDTVKNTIWSKNNVYIFRADDNKSVVYDKWAKGSADSVYLDKGDYVAVITPGGVIDYSRLGYSLVLDFHPLKKYAPEKTIEADKAYDDKLTSAEDVNTYQVTTTSSMVLTFQTNQPVGEYTGKASFFDSGSKCSYNEQLAFRITVENEEGEEIDSVEVALSNCEIRLPSPAEGETSRTSTIKVSAINYSPETYTFFVEAGK